MSQRYPAYFDGLVSGAPAMRTGFSNLGMRSVAVALSSAAAQRDASGAVVRRQRTLGDRQEAHRRLAAENLRRRRRPRRRLDLRSARAATSIRLTLVCSGAKNDSCLSAAQASAVKTGALGTEAASGRQVYPGYLYDTGITTTAAGIPGVLNGAAGPVGPRVPPTAQDVDAEAAQVLGEPSTLGDTAGWTNLSSFSGHGGKLLFYHGVSDPWFSSLDTVRVLREARGRERRRGRHARLEPAVSRAGHGSLRRRLDARSVRPAVRDRRLGREGPRAGFRRRDGQRVPGPQPAALPASAAHALQRLGQPRGRRELRVPLSYTE